MNTQHLVDKCIRDKNHRVVIWQWPNLPIAGWFSFAVAAHLAHTMSVHAGFSNLSTAFLFVWAYLEITRGANYFRRLLGVLVAVAIVVHYFR